MAYCSDGAMGQNRQLATGLIYFCALLLPVLVNAQTKSIIIGEGVRGAMYLPAYIAEEKGFFKRRELDTRMVTFSRSNDINALVSGDIQFDLTSPDKVVHSALGGFPVKMVMGTARGLNLALTVHPSIRSAADLKGKSVAITGFSGLPYTGLLLCLRELGLTKEQVVPLNSAARPRASKPCSAIACRRRFLIRPTQPWPRRRGTACS